MTTLAAYILVAVFATLVVADMDKLDFERQSFKECGEELKIDINADDIEEGNLKCLFKCSMEKEGIMKGGVIDEKGAEKAIRDEEKIPEEDKGKAISAITECKEEAKEGDDCQKAFDFTVCMLKVLE